MIFGSRIKGRVRLKVTGGRGEELMTRLAEETALWDGSFENGALFFWAPLSSLGQIRRAAQECGCYVTVAGRGGLPFVRKNIRRHRFSWLAAVFAAVLLCLFLSAAWQVRIVSETESAVSASLEKEIRAALADSGALPPVRKSAVDTEAAAEAILRRCPSLSWAGISFDGVFMTVSVAGRHSESAPSASCGHIVADTDGVIRQILVLKGQKQAEVGDTVKKGDILISGDLTYEEEGKDPVHDETAAKGVVTASVWYAAAAYVSPERVEAESTGNYAGIVTLSKDGKSFVLWGSEKNPYTDWIAEEYSCSLFGWKLAVKTYGEAVTRTKKLDIAAAKDLAEKKAGREAQKKWGGRGKIVGREVTERNDVPGAVGVEVILETEEEIGVFREAPTALNF